MTTPHVLLAVVSLLLATGCDDGGNRGTCLLETAEQSWACVDYSSQLSSSEAENACGGAGGQWQESPCSLEAAIGECEDLAGSTTVYYADYLLAFSLTESDLRTSCEEAEGIYSDL